MPEYQLFIMRHAKSDWSEEGRSDFDRPLTIRGIKAAKQMAKWLKHKQYHIDRIICSPALRAKQTCQLVANTLNLSEKAVRFESGIYDASRYDLTALIKQYSKGIHSLLIIEHNPSLDQLLCYLSREPPPVNNSGKLLTTAALAVLNYGSSAISATSHEAQLRYLIRPKEL
ncbi:phosphohistidine phosphatase SixA [Nitrosomonas supralitoralis]|uniref:Phosphohistidine phosphatase SixA n=1 Tax=Nitrosomonas supralitoralis TaxID=2116706 RepID=A0A2P7NZR0_9PROT|nr:phosphohistidine phosphatase SixA [Nitrosomonas supralitoralis]PSJ18924.1 phosphohistidine phosphatase SixA [Nitrosomonas supralitoralis]